MGPKRLASAARPNEPATPAASTTPNFNSAGTESGWIARASATITGGWRTKAPYAKGTVSRATGRRG